MHKCIDVPLPSENIGERGAFVQRLMYVKKLALRVAFVELL